MRSSFLIPWIHIPGNRLFKYTEFNKLYGFVVMRKAKTGYKIGPLFADNRYIAEELYKACISSAPHEPIYIDIPMANANAVDMVHTFGAKEQFECARMYYGQAPDLDIQKVYGMSSFELG